MNEVYKKIKAWEKLTLTFIGMSMIFTAFFFMLNPKFANDEFQDVYKTPKKAMVLQKVIDEYSNYYLVISYDGSKS